MAEKLKNSDRLSVTSPDPGSSCGCDNDAIWSSDVKDQSDDAISVAGSTSLTIDSLEEEETKEQNRVEVPIAAIIHSEMLKYSSGKDSFQLHGQKDGHKDRCQPSKVFVHSDGRITTRADSPDSSGRGGVKEDDQPSADKQKTKCHHTSEKQNSSQSEEGELTSVKYKLTTTNSQRSQSKEQLPSETESVQSSVSFSAGSARPRTATTSSDETEGKLTLRKSRSLTGESSTDPASTKHSRRSCIPRRKSSTHSMVTVLSSGRSSPQSSPARARRSMTLDSTGLDWDLPSASRGRVASPPPGRSSPRSFPTSPVKLPGRLKRSASQCECLNTSAMPCPPSVFCRDTVTSRLRFERNHQDHCRVGCPTGTYLTPSQRKDLILKELKAEVRELSRQLDEKDREIDELRKLAEEEKLRVRQELAEEVDGAQQSAEAARMELTSLQELHTQSLTRAATLQKQLDDVKKDMRSKLAESEAIFLEMYNKGRQSAIFEHEEEMEIKRKGGRSQEETEKELYDKLVKAQAELAKWQTIQHHESFHTMPIPGTEAETTLRFLKDSVFHYLTTEKAASDEHLRAIVRILHFSEAQREKIAHAIIYKRNKSGW